MKIKTYVLLQSYATNTYLVWDEKSKEALLIDPADKGEEVLNFINKNDLKLKYIVNTHGHGDHIGGNKFFLNNSSAKLCIHKKDADMLINPSLNLSSSMGFNLVSSKADITFSNNDEIKIGNLDFKVIHTPGHTKGGICLLHKTTLFSGDTLFYRSIGRTDLPGGNFNTIKNSLKKLSDLNPKTVVYPGHGESTTIKTEKRENPYLN